MTIKSLSSGLDNKLYQFRYYPKHYARVNFEILFLVIVFVLQI